MDQFLNAQRDVIALGTKVEGMSKLSLSLSILISLPFSHS